jgi:hypothetical protein
MAADREPDPATLAEAALGLVGTDPRRARRLAAEAAEAAAAAARAGAPGTESRAHRAAGLAALTAGQLDDAPRRAADRGWWTGRPGVPGGGGCRWWRALVCGARPRR